jgi:YebC/PmpR family DNA-binding regulatory protein
MGRGWIQGIKSENSAKKGALMSKLAREIQVASKMGGPDVNFNARLRMAVDAAKKASCSADMIDRAIKKGSGQLEGSSIDEIQYEGYGPHGVGVIVEAQSDNKNRTASEMRLMFKSHGGALGEQGSVAWMFERVCALEATKAGSFDPEEEAIEAGANEVEKQGEVYLFYGSPEELDHVRKGLEARGWKIVSAELSFKAKNITTLTADQKKEVMEFLNELNDHDDTHRMHATLAD